MLSLLICHTTPAKRFIWKFSKVVRLTFIELCGMKHKSSRYFYILLKVAGVPKNVGQTGRGRAVGGGPLFIFCDIILYFILGAAIFTISCWYRTIWVRPGRDQWREEALLAAVCVGIQIQGACKSVKLKPPHFSSTSISIYKAYHCIWYPVLTSVFSEIGDDMKHPVPVVWLVVL